MNVYKYTTIKMYTFLVRKLSKNELRGKASKETVMLCQGGEYNWVIKYYQLS